MRALALVLAVGVCAGCSTRSDIYCDETRACPLADLPFCDLYGVYPESKGVAKTCISACTPGETLRCDGSTLLVCSSDGTAETSIACNSGCDDAKVACTDCEPDTDVCAADTLTKCDSYGQVQDTQTCTFGCETSGTACVAGCMPGETLRCDSELLIVCDSNGTAEMSLPCDTTCNATQLLCDDCSPEAVSCATGTLTTCDINGRVASTETCTLGCASSADRCLDVDPSNNLASLLDMAATGPDLVLDESMLGSITIDTATGMINYTNAGATFSQPPSMLVAGPDIFGPVDVRVYYVRSLTIRGTVTVLAQQDGSPAVAFVSDGDVSIDGVLDVSANGNLPGPGAEPDPEALCHGQDSPAADGGGGGASFHQMSGAKGGGPAGVPDDGGVPGQAASNQTLIPLRGGCAGGAPLGGGQAGGAGGGALQIVSRTQIVVGGTTGFSSIAANGGGGPAGSFGGGSGGGILLEAPAVTINSTGRVIAVGGSGGCYNMAAPDEGISGDATDTFADCAPPYGSGGLGGRGASSLALPGGQAGAGGTGGGGGGGHGLIQINTAAGGPTISGPIFPQDFVSNNIGTR